MREREKWLVLLVSSACLGGCSGGSNDTTPLTSLVGGAVSGLAGSGLILSLNGGADLAVGANGTFIFATGLASGTGYTVSVKTQPVVPYQTCSVTNATGTMGDSAVANISVACTTNSYAVRGTVAGLVGSGLTLRLSPSVSLPVNADGDFTFPGQVASGSNYAVTVSRQPQSPFQTCVAANATGVMGGSDTNIAVTCTTDTFSVGGTVTGLTGLGLVLQLNGGQDLPVSVDGTFVFPDRLLRGSQYAVTIASQPSTYRELCGLGGASGTGGAANITNVKIACGVVAGFVYRSDGDGQIFKFGVHPTTGALLPLGLAAVASDNNSRLVVAPSGATLYAIDMVTSTIRAFSIEPSTGALTAIGAPVTTGVPDAWVDQAVVHPSGEFLYAFEIRLGTVVLMSIDSATGALQYERQVASSVPASSYSWREHLAISPDGSYLYVLNYAYGNPAPPSLTVYAINPVDGNLAALATVDAQNATGITMDPLGRFLYLRDTTVAGNVAYADVAVYPYSINPTTGAVTPITVTTRVVGSNGSDMIVDPSGRYAYILGNFNYVDNDKRIDAFAIDSSTGALTANGAGVLTPGRAAQIVVDSGGRFVFATNRKPAGTYDPSQVWCDGSTFAVSGAGATQGQILDAGTACSIGSADPRAIVYVD